MSIEEMSIEEMSIEFEGEEDFFDTTDHFLSDSNLEYDVWLKEPLSVTERRKTFLSKMGFVDFVESEVTYWEMISECSAAVSSSCGSSNVSMDENLLSERRESNSEADCSVDYSDQDWLDCMNIHEKGEIYENLSSEKENFLKVDEKKKKFMGWWRNFTRTMKKSEVSKEKRKMNWIKIVPNHKKYMECTSVCAGQEIKAHNGLIWSIKFSPDGQYLASGGEDGIVCIWRVCLVDSSCEPKECSFGSHETVYKSSKQKKRSVSILLPEQSFRIEEKPIHKFWAHSSDVLDLAWSESNHLLSSSVDKTVRLWRVGSDKCLGVFHHNNYVTCVQFNPMDENHFISGSIDGKVRIWGVHTRRVEDWANVKDVVTAVCYKPNGKGFVVGSISGTCRFYELLGDEFLLHAEINMNGRKKFSGNKITGIQFLKNDSQRVMITSEDSKIRILDGLEIVHKYRGLKKSGSQISASFTSSGSHIISTGEDSRVYMWNYDDLSIQKSKQAKSISSHEHFFSEGVSVALTWSNTAKETNSLTCEDSCSSVSRVGDSERFCLANWFSMDGSSRASITWPEEKLPSAVEHDLNNGSRILSTTWGLVFVTAHRDGTIRTFHNYGLPVSLGAS